MGNSKDTREILGLLGFFNFFSCCSPSRLQRETVLSEIIRVEVPHEDTGASTFKNTKIAITEKLTPNIAVIHQDSKHLKYELQGFVASSGLAINRVKRIGLEKVITGDSMLLKHIVEIVHIPGKEGSLVMGYNYTQMESVPIPETVRNVRIELYEKKAIRSPYDQNQETRKHMATAELEVK